MGSASVQLENGFSEEYLFDPLILEQLKWEKSEQKFQPKISPQHPGENLKMRPLQINDYNKGFLQLLAQLTRVGEITSSEFIDSFLKMKESKGTYYIIVVEDTEIIQIVGAATLFVEQKFIHNCAQKGYLEDVVVSEDYRGKQLGKLLVETTLQLSQELGLYKVVLNCKDQMINFYKSFGYNLEVGNSNLMVVRFRD